MPFSSWTCVGMLTSFGTSLKLSGTGGKKASQIKCCHDLSEVNAVALRRFHGFFVDRVTSNDPDILDLSQQFRFVDFFQSFLHAFSDNDVIWELILFRFTREDDVKSFRKWPLTLRNTEISFPSHDHNILLRCILNLFSLRWEVFQLISTSKTKLISFRNYQYISYFNLHGRSPCFPIPRFSQAATIKFSLKFFMLGWI